MTTFSDDFDRADGALGSDWETGGTLGTDLVIASNAVVRSGIGVGYAFLTESVDDDQAVTITIGTTGSSAYFELYARADEASDFPTNHYGAIIARSAGDWSWDLFSWVAGNSGLFDEFVLPGDVVTTGDTITLSVVGSTVRLLHNDSEVSTFTSTEITSGSHCGFALQANSSNASVDAFSLAASSVQTFMPPSFGRIPTTVPRGFPQWDGVSNALMRNYRPRQEGTNVYLLSDGTVTETDPDSTNVFWHSYEGSVYVKRVFWGSTADPYELTAAEATALTDAGYTVT